jgi:hypothetical protein
MAHKIGMWIECVEGKQRNKKKERDTTKNNIETECWSFFVAYKQIFCC